MKKSILIFLMCLLISGCSKNYQNINLKETKEKMLRGAYLVDVRSKAEYKNEHIKGAINIPVEEIENPKKKIISKNDIIIVYCKSGGRSKIAAQKLIKIGYKYVYNFGAITNWK